MITFWPISRKQKHNIVFLRHHFKGGQCALPQLCFHPAAWNVDARAGALAAILDHEAPLGMEVTSWESRAAGGKSLGYLMGSHNIPELPASRLVLNEKRTSILI